MNMCKNCMWQDKCCLADYYNLHNDCDDYYSIFEEDIELIIEKEYKEYLDDMQKYINKNKSKRLVSFYGKILIKI